MIEHDLDDFTCFKSHEVVPGAIAVPGTGTHCLVLDEENLLFV
jgi:hypothetical protein